MSHTVETTMDRDEMLEAARTAIEHLLMTVRERPDLRYYLAHTEAWERLVVAQAMLTGTDPAAAKQMWGQCPNDDEPRVVSLQRRVRELEVRVEELEW